MNTEKWTSQIDKVTKDFIQNLCSLSGEQLNRKPNSQTWSIAQNIDHLIITNESYFHVISSIRDGTYSLPLTAKLGFVVSFFGKTIINAVQPGRQRKMKTFAVWQPSQSEISPEILDRFERHQEELKQMITNSSDLLDKGVIISSPANKNIVYKLETAFDIIITHEERHFQQAIEVLEFLNKPTNSLLT